MKMILTLGMVAACLLLSFGQSIRAEDAAAGKGAQGTEVQGAASQGDGKWEAAGHEVQEATGAVMDATHDTASSAWDSFKSGSSEVWEKTKTGSRELYDTVGEKSKQAWDATREESQDLWRKGKAALHEATAPESPAAVKAPQTPPKPTPPTPPAHPESAAPESYQL